MADDSGQQALMQAMMAGSLYGPNIYSHYPNGIPPTSYRGTLTDAMGNPIQPPPGVTLNTSPATPATQATPAVGGGWNQNPVGSPLNPMGDWTQLAPVLPGASQQQQANYAYNLGLGGFIDPATQQAYIGSQGQAGTAGGAGQQQQAAAPADTSYQDALSRLSDPGKVTTPGATVPQAASLGDQVPSVLQAFLASRSGGKGAGNYNNQPFFDTLNALRG